jgi:short-subunit dehydrogenase
MSNFRPVTLITGASAGIGAALAEVFAANGHEVALLARREPQLKALAQAIAAKGHTRPHVLPIDLSTADAADRLIAALDARGIEPQYVVNNAGFGLLGAAAELNRGEQIAMIDLNVRVLTDLSLRFIDSVTRHRGGILNVASIASFMPGPDMAVYHATKAYVLSFSEALYRELKPQGVRVTALCPGPVETEFMARAGIPPDYFPSFMARSVERVAREGYDGLMHGDRVVLPGGINRIAAFLSQVSPRAVTMAVLRLSRKG